MSNKKNKKKLDIKQWHSLLISLYIKSNKSSRNRDIIEMLGVKGVIDRDKYPRELSFPKNRFVVAINNTNYGRLNRKKMLTLAECLQLN